MSQLIDRFPFLFGRAFIEATAFTALEGLDGYFPSFSEGLSLRPAFRRAGVADEGQFPFLFGRAFIEAHHHRAAEPPAEISLPFRKGFH